MTRVSSDELRDRQRDVPEVGSIWRHRARGFLTSVTGSAVLESDLSLLVTYWHDGVVFARPASEFRERFEPLK